MTPQDVIAEFGLSSASDPVAWMVAADRVEESGNPVAAAAFRAGLWVTGPISNGAGNGDGNGDGYGDGDGYGNGNGDGSGDGAGHGNGDGYGDG